MKQKESEIKKEDDNKGPGQFSRIRKSPLFFPIILLLIIVILISGLLIYQNLNSRVYIEQSEIYAPIISLGPSTPGILDKVFVKEGDFAGKGRKVAQVNGIPIYPKTYGIIVSVTDTPGQLIPAGTGVVKMINPEDLRVIGRLEEDKGLKYIKPGQKVIFSVDAFKSNNYEGVVESISPTARQSDIVFSISDKRQERQFDVKIKFDVEKYPELRNGMSAKAWVYK